MTIEGFIAWEERQELRFEFDGFFARAMTGGSTRLPPFKQACCVRWATR